MDLMALILFIFFYACQALIYAGIFLPVLKQKTSKNDDNKGVSVIICAKNEARNIEKNLERICLQNYPRFEVILMDDHSTDDTQSLVRQLCRSYSNLVYYRASDEIKDAKGKKRALSEARSRARYDHLVLTDADCRPVSANWLTLMVSKFRPDVEIVLGIGQYAVKKGMLNNLVQYETMFTAMSYLGLAVTGNPYMGVGRNLAYTKLTSEDEKEKGRALLSGDDDLYLQSRFNAKNTAICIEDGAQTISDPPEDFRTWIRQKSRHFSTAPYYPKKSQFQLLAIKSSFYIPNILFIYLLTGKMALPAFFLFTLRSVVYWSYWNKMRMALHVPRKIYFLPCYELFFTLFDVWMTSKNLMKIPSRWK